MQGDLPSEEGRLAPSPLSIRLPSCDSEEHISRSAIAMPSASTSADEPVILYSPYFFTNLTGKNLPLSSSSMAFIIFMSFRKIPLLDTEAKAAAISNKKNVIVNFEREIKKAFYRDEAEAEQIASTRAIRISGITDEASPDDFVD